MDYGRALGFITEDPRWKEKVTIGTVVVLLSTLLTPILVGLLGYLIVMGYSVRLLQNVRDEHPTPLPEWDRWGDDLVLGLKLFVVTLVWSLPLIVLMIPNAAGSFIAGIDPGEDVLVLVGTLISACAGCLIALYSIFVAVVTPGFTVAFARDEQISSGLQFSYILNWIRDRLGPVIIVVIAVLVASIIILLAAVVVGGLLCLIGLVVTIPLGVLVIYLFQHHLYGQLARYSPDGEAALTSPKPVGA